MKQILVTLLAITLCSSIKAQYTIKWNGGTGILYGGGTNTTHEDSIFNIEPPYYLIKFGDNSYGVAKDMKISISQYWFLKETPTKESYFSDVVTEALHHDDSVYVKARFREFIRFTTYKVLNQ